MNLTSTILRSLLLMFTIAVGLALFGCESDPLLLLTPQSEVAEEGGSYGNTNLPVSGTENPENAVKAAQNGKINGNHRKITNPKRF